MANTFLLQELESAQQEGYIKWADRVILMYSITDLSSFEAATALIASIAETKGAANNISLVANKTDLAHLRQVSCP